MALCLWQTCGNQFSVGSDSSSSQTYGLHVSPFLSTRPSFQLFKAGSRLCVRRSYSSCGSEESPFEWLKLLSHLGDDC